MSMLVCSTNDSGSAPNFSWSERPRAWSSVNPPVMLARPSRIASLKRGATMTRESRVAASWFCGSGRRHHRAADVGVLLGALAVEGQRDLDLARHRALLVGAVAGGGVADLVAGHGDRAEDVLGAAVDVAGDERLRRVVDEAVEGSGSVQSRSSNCSVSSGVIHARSVGSSGVAPAAGLALGEAVGDAEPARRRGRRVSASGTALLLVGEALLAVGGRRRRRRARGAGRRAARRRRRRLRSAGRHGEHGAELQLGGLADRVADLLGGDLRDAHDDVAVALGRHLGAGDTTGVDALDDDVAGLVQLLGRDALARGGLAAPG